jgi:hypothetical protein
MILDNEFISLDINFTKIESFINEFVLFFINLDIVMLNERTTS